MVGDLINQASGWPGMVVRLDGSRMRTVPSLFGEFARALRFPDYFGYNWPAFHECMTELEATPAPGFLLVIEHSEDVLADDLDDLPTFMRQLGDIGEYWSRSFGLGPQWGGGEVPFHTLLCASGPLQ